MGHCHSEPLVNVIRNSGKNWPGIKVDVNRLVDVCKVCIVQSP